jgi:peptidoglycan DL-endopeptidase CwlO
VRAGRRTRIARLTAVAGTVALAAGALSPAAEADPEPTIAEVSERVDELHHRAEQSIERYNTIGERVKNARGRLADLQAELDDQRDKTEELRLLVEQVVLAQVSGAGGVDTTAQLLSIPNPADFISAIFSMRSYSESSAGLLLTYEDAKATLAEREQVAADELARIVDAQERAERAKQRTNRRAHRAELLLEELEDARAERLAAIAASQASRDADRDEAAESSEADAAPAPSAPVSGSAGQAVATALAQVGDSYVYGAVGPDSFDCSGLTMYAWAAAGVSLPHSSSMQAGAGQAVAYSDMQPGDLVFYYSPISHVGMYIGNGQLVHASNPSSPVEVVDVDLMPIASIRRVG